MRRKLPTPLLPFFRLHLVHRASRTARHQGAGTASPMSRLLLSIMLVIVLALPARAQPLHVARVIDGDTFELSDGRKVRLIGIDAPETFATYKLDRDAERTGQDRATIQALGARATEAARRLADGRAVALEFDAANVATGHKGRYGRLLAYVWVLDAAGNRLYMVNERLVAEGYAYAYLKYPFRRADVFHRLEREARAAGRGLWHPDPEAPVLLPLSDEAAAVVYVTDTGRRYHRPTCAHLRYSKTPVPLGEVPSRFTPCRVCHPPDRL